MSTYNARVIDWICCPDCGSNVLRAEQIDAQGEPLGAIECVCCGFAARLDAGEQLVLEADALCQQVGHEFMPVGYADNGDVQMICVWCGKRMQ